MPLEKETILKMEVDDVKKQDKCDTHLDGIKVKPFRIEARDLVLKPFVVEREMYL